MKLINPIPSSDKYIYHYTKLDTALNHILLNGTLKLNSFSNVNDPRENKDWNIGAWVRLKLNLSYEDYDNLSLNISNLLKSNLKLLCFCKDRKEATQKWQPQALPDRGFTKPSMWHHYAEAHKGVCLMFDREKLQKAMEAQVDKNQLMANEVKYSDEGILPKLENDPYIVNLTDCYSESDYLNRLNSHVRHFINPLFFRKLSDWSNEEEYRWVYIDNNSAPKFIKFNDALEAIIIGEKVPASYEESFLKYCAQYRAEITRLEWRNGYPAIISPGQPYIAL